MSLKFCSKFKCLWVWKTIPYVGFSGGIIVLWKRSAGLITLIAISRMSLNLVISSHLFGI